MAMKHARLSLPAMRQTAHCDHLAKCTSKHRKNTTAAFNDEANCKLQTALVTKCTSTYVRTDTAAVRVHVYPCFCAEHPPPPRSHEGPRTSSFSASRLPSHTQLAYAVIRLVSTNALLALYGLILSTANQTNGSAAGKKCQIPTSATITTTKKPKPQYTVAQAPQMQAIETYFFCSSSYADKLCVWA
jgi:hypothetical protein